MPPRSTSSRAQLLSKGVSLATDEVAVSEQQQLGQRAVQSGAAGGAEPGGAGGGADAVQAGAELDEADSAHEQGVAPGDVGVSPQEQDVAPGDGADSAEHAGAPIAEAANSSALIDTEYKAQEVSAAQQAVLELGEPRIYEVHPLGTPVQLDSAILQGSALPEGADGLAVRRGTEAEELATNQGASQMQSLQLDDPVSMSAAAMADADGQADHAFSHDMTWQVRVDIAQRCTWQIQVVMLCDIAFCPFLPLCKQHCFAA